MKIHIKNGVAYRLPSKMTDFQREMYIHLIDWKWHHLTKEPGYHDGFAYDAILPDEYKVQYLPIYRPVVDMFLAHQKRFHFKTHTFIGHMASSQAACANLFLPLLQHPDAAAKIFRSVKPDIHRIAVEWFDLGYRLEFWDEPDNMLNDHNPATGTDSDIAIAYYDQNDNLNLWLIEHKLTEPEFTTCGGYKSRNRNRQTHRCESVADIMDDRSLCYYQGVSGFKYWDITLSNQALFNRVNLLKTEVCPFQGGLNQLWRNQLLALAIEASRSERWPFHQVYFSVVRHPGNNALDTTIEQYKRLLGDTDRFSAFSSEILINRAQQLNFAYLRDWLDWYRSLYYF